jgi:ferredoxin-NADP reductase
MHGPYGTSGVDLSDTSYKTFLFLSGGIGITPMNSIAN